MVRNPESGDHRETDQERENLGPFLGEKMSGRLLGIGVFGCRIYQRQNQQRNRDGHDCIRKEDESLQSARRRHGTKGK